MLKSKFILFSTVVFAIASCNPKNNYCDQPEVTLALKEALVLDMKEWLDSAKYAGIDNFESEADKVIEGIEVVETLYIGANKQFTVKKESETNSCRCRTKIRFKNHDDYKQKIKDPVAKVRAEEHRMNSAYLRLEGQMNYLDNDGFIFSYVVIKEDVAPVKVIKSYPYPLQTNIDKTGGLIFNYMKAYLKN